MRLTGPKRADADLLWMTSLSSLDGTIPLLAAQGRFGSATQSVAIGLTIVAGIGAWVAAWQAFPQRPGRRDLLGLLGVAALSSGLTVAAVAAGTRWGHHLHVLPHVVGGVILLIALQVAGFRLPRLGRVGPPGALVLGAAAVEVAHWIP